MTQPTVSRRTVLKTGAATAGVLLLGRTAKAATPTAEIESIDVVSKLPGKYHGWPTLARKQDGELLLVCSGDREGHICPFGRVVLQASRDDGKSWTWPRILLDSATDDRDAGALETNKGTLLVTTFTSLAYEPTYEKLKAAGGEKFERWDAAHRRTNDAQRNADVGVWMIRSEDGGATWSTRYDVPLNSPHGPIQLADGRQLYAGKQLWTTEKRAGVAESSDDGKTWKWLADIPTRPGDDQGSYHELHAVEASPGRIIVQIRNHNATNNRETLQCESDDGGKTWTTPHEIGVWGLPSHLLRLADGRLLMSYGHRRKPFGNQARISSDEGRSWSEPLMISDDGAGGDLGYPSTVELEDGTLLTAWYEHLKDSPYAVLRLARWRLG